MLDKTAKFKPSPKPRTRAKKRALTMADFVPPPAAIEELPTPIVAPPAEIAPPAPTKLRKVAIVGTAPSSRGLAPLNDPEWEIWACSPGNQNLSRVDVWFEVHSLEAEWVDCENARKVEWIEFLKDKPKVVMDKVYPGIPGSRPYPILDLIQEFDGSWFFTSTPSMMMALAIAQKVDVIGVFGVDLAQAAEYACERSGFQFWIREAGKRGIQIIIPPESDVGEPPPVYGIHLGLPMTRKILARRGELLRRIVGLEATLNRDRDELSTLRGALQDLDWVLKTWAK